MQKNITLKSLQEFIKAKDHNPELKHAYFMKLVEEVGELGRVLRKNDFRGEKLRKVLKGNCMMCYIMF